jgi:pyruvate dehydrogenase E2 component (dihydrolipoamide acetyltransferase)
MFGVEEFTAVIYPTQAAILAVAAIRDTAVLREGNTIRARMMRVTLSADHRIVDGADAARFLSELRKILGNPYMMLV